MFLFVFIFPSEAAFLPDVREAAFAFSFGLFCYTVGLFEREKPSVLDDTFLEAK